MGQKIIPGTNLKIQNIFCIGRNYSEHARELNNPVPTTPVVFIKPTSSICYDGGNLILPVQSEHVDHEVEIVIAIGISGKNIPESNALDYISHIGIGLDFTARDLQDKAKEKSLPWSVAKGFDTFAAISSFVPFSGSASELNNLTFQLEVNGEIKQKGDSKNMIFSILISFFYLYPFRGRFNFYRNSQRSRDLESWRNFKSLYDEWPNTFPRCPKRRVIINYKRIKFLEKHPFSLS